MLRTKFHILELFTDPLGDIRRSSCGEGDVGRLCSSVVRAVDRQSKDLGSNPIGVESVFFSTERFSNSLNVEGCYSTRLTPKIFDKIHQSSIVVS